MAAREEITEKQKWVSAARRDLLDALEAEIDEEPAGAVHCTLPWLVGYEAAISKVRAIIAKHREES